MNAAEFVITLERLAPSRDDLNRCGYSDSEADEFLKCFRCGSRSSEQSIAAFDDAMLDLICRWDMSSVEIGSLTFLPEAKESSKSSDYLVVGRLETDLLAFDKKSYRWVLLDGDDETRILCEAAESGESLLLGLLCAAGFYAHTSVELLSFDDAEAMQRIKSECVARLGGMEYEPFCTSILGV